MKKLLIVSSLFAFSAFAGEWTGVISESHCGAKHSAGTEADQKCVQGCVKKGAKPVLVSEGKVIELTDGSKVQDYLGKKVTVKGTMSGEKLTVESVAAAQ